MRILVYNNAHGHYLIIGQKLLVTRLNKSHREEDLEATLQVILYATESSGSSFQSFIGNLHFLCIVTPRLRRHLRHPQRTQFHQIHQNPNPLPEMYPTIPLQR
jgi:hypothetical protein